MLFFGGYGDNEFLNLKFYVHILFMQMHQKLSCGAVGLDDNIRFYFIFSLFKVNVRAKIVPLLSFSLCKLFNKHLLRQNNRDEVVKLYFCF